MRILSYAGLSLLLVGALTAAAPATVRLRPVELKPETLRLGFGLTGKIPDIGYAGRVGETNLVFVDLDRDGRLETNGDDACRFPPGQFLIRLDDFLLLEAGQFTIAFAVARDRWTLQLAEDNQDLPAALVRQASVITRLRQAAGRPLARLDAAASQDCARHLEYLARNPDQRGVGVHYESPDRKGFSERGRLAAIRSCIYPDKASFTVAMEDFARTVWHGFPISDPRVTAFGAAADGETCMFYPQPGRQVTADSLVCSPADEQIDIPTAFASRGEIPDPIPGGKRPNGKGCGHPVMMLVQPPHAGRKLVKAELLPITREAPDERHDDAVQGTLSCPQQPANPKYNPTNFGLAVFVPDHPLKPRTHYRVQFHFDGIDTPVTWTFTTENRL